MGEHRVQMDFNCLYCDEPNRTFKSKYHIVPYSLGNNEENPRFKILDELVLPPGIVCDDCNTYFGKHLDSPLVLHPIVSLWKTLYRRSGYKCKTPKYSNENVSIFYTNNQMVLQNKNNSEMIGHNGSLQIPTPSLVDVEHSLVSRAIHRIAFEYLIFESLKQKNLPLVKQEFSSVKYATIRKYIREPDKKQYRPYGMASTPEGDIAVSPLSFTKSEDLRLVAPEIQACVVNLPGVRFLCTLADDAEGALKWVRSYLDNDPILKSYTSVTHIYSTSKGECLVSMK